MHPLLFCISFLIVLLPGVARSEELFQPRPVSSEAYAESYTSVVDLEDDTYVLLQLMFTNAGMGDQKAACRALIVPPGSKGNNSVKRYSRDEWKYVPKEKGLYVGECSLSTLGKKTDFVVKTGTAHAYLTIDAAPSKTKPPGSRLTYEKAFLESEIFIRNAAAKLTLVMGGKTYSKKGRAYLDHSRSTALMPNIASRWLRFRGLRSNESILFQIRYPSDSSKAPTGWVWSNGSKIAPLTAKMFQAQIADNKVSVRGLTQPFEFEMLTKSLIYDYRPVKQYGMLGALAKPWIGNPINRTFRAQVRYRGKIITGTIEYQELAK
ncbi:MAG: hypothetical protein VYC39_12660 [Myxococcota bacterium]|nr:hypothetical protein [Myxococcota bacterium]